MTKNKKIVGFIFPLAMGFLLMAFLGACKSEERTEEKSEMRVISKEMLTPIFGEGEGSVSGLIDFDQDDAELDISYYLFTEDMSSFDEEIEAALAPKIQELYTKIPEVDRTVFTVYVPAMDETPYKPFVSFIVTRKLVEETEWDNLLELDFFQVVMDVKYYE